MAKKYNAKHMLQLLKICSWKNGSSIDHKGFGDLADAINAKLISSGYKTFGAEIKQKYLNELHLDSQRAHKLNIEISKNETYIDFITSYLDTSWPGFQEKTRLLESCIDIAKIDLSTFSECKVTLFNHEPTTHLVKQALLYPEGKLDIPLHQHISKTCIADLLINELEKIVNTSPFVIWFIDNMWNEVCENLQHNLQLKSLLSNGQVIPIRIGNTLSEYNLTSNLYQNKFFSSGELGILIALSTIEMILSNLTDQKAINSNHYSTKTKIEIHNNSGTIFSGDNLELKGEQICLRDFIQHFDSKAD